MSDLAAPTTAPAAYSPWAFVAWALAVPGPLFAVIAAASGASALKALGDPAGVLFFGVVLDLLSGIVAIGAIVHCRKRGRRGLMLAALAIPAALLGGMVALTACVGSAMPHLG